MEASTATLPPDSDGRSSRRATATTPPGVFRMLNPIERTQSPDMVGRYRLEPYLIAGDIASVEPHAGREGWRWYTGAAGWCWRLGVEAILRLRQVRDGLRIEPHLPRRRPGFEAAVHTEGGILEIKVENGQGSRGGAVEIVVDGARIEANVVELPSNGATRRVRVRTRASEYATGYKKDKRDR
jgi:cyclic beta-1,2-glucan synthetase